MYIHTSIAACVCFWSAQPLILFYMCQTYSTYKVATTLFVCTLSFGFKAFCISFFVEGGQIQIPRFICNYLVICCAQFSFYQLLPMTLFGMMHYFGLCGMVLSFYQDFFVKRGIAKHYSCRHHYFLSIRYNVFYVVKYFPIAHFIETLFLIDRLVPSFFYNHGLVPGGFINYPTLILPRLFALSCTCFCGACAL